MKKLVLLALFISLPSLAQQVTSISTTGTGTLTECQDSWGGFVVSCKDEKVAIPKYITVNDDFYVIFLGERRGYQTGFDAAKVNFNPKKNGCSIHYSYNGGTSTISTANCRVIKE